MKAFKFLPHTADIRLEVRGKTLSELFENAASGLFCYLAVPVNAKTTFRRTLKISGVDAESLLVCWLSELLYLSLSNNVILDSFSVKLSGLEKIEAAVSGKKIQPGSRLVHEIKAVTYHKLKIKQTRSGFRTEIIFDV